MLTPQRSFTYGLTSFYSTNEDGGRASLRAGYSSARVALQVHGGLEQFGNYQAGKFDVEDTNPLFASGQLHRGDTIDDAFGFTFKAFPDPFNAPFVRTSGEIPNSGGDGYFVNANGVVKLTEGSRLRMRYQHRRAKEIGFPDFAEPYFFNATSLPRSDFDRASVRYETQALSARLASLSVTGYVQRTQPRAAESSARSVSGADTHGVFPDRGHAPGHRVRNRPARVDAWCGRAGGLDAGQQPSADDRRHVLSRPEPRRAHHRHDHIDGGPGGDGPARTCAGGLPVAGAARTALDRSSGARARCVAGRPRVLCAGRVAGAQGRLGGRRASW